MINVVQFARKQIGFDAMSECPDIRVPVALPLPLSIAMYEIILNERPSFVVKDTACLEAYMFWYTQYRWLNTSGLMPTQDLKENDELNNSGAA